MMNAWMRRWSWAIAMVVSIVITVGGLIILESGRQRVASEYETVLDARAAIGNLYRFVGEASALIANQRGLALTGDAAYREAADRAMARMHALSEQIDGYYQRQRDGHARHVFAQTAASFAQRAAAPPASVPAVSTTAAGAAAVIARAAARQADAASALNGDVRQLIDEENLRAQRALDASREDQRVSTLCVAAVSALNIVLFVLLFRNLGLQIDTQSREQVKLLTEQDMLDGLVRERTGQLEALAWHLQTVSENEKTQLARELHDELGAILTASRMDVASVRTWLRGVDLARAEKLDRALAYLDQGIALKRRIIEDMRPTVLANFGLVTALRSLVDEAAQRNGWQASLTMPEHDVPLEEPLSIALFRIAQEALTNAAKYAGATTVLLALDVGADFVRLRVEDDGVGIAPADLQRSKAHGLLGMRQRVAAHGGDFKIAALPAGGTAVSVFMPRPPAVGMAAPVDAAAHDL
ncbi:MAG: sensor histidine kinase [Janthinobacterium lividum]